jgi:hypothetical protein
VIILYDVLCVYVDVPSVFRTQLAFQYIDGLRVPRLNDAVSSHTTSLREPQSKSMCDKVQLLIQSWQPLSVVYYYTRDC